MNYKKFGAGDYQLMKEEHLRECIPSDLGYALNKESGRREPAIVLRQPLKDKTNLLSRDINTSWSVAQGHGNIELLFLNINFRAAEGIEAVPIRICIDKFNPEVMDWFRLLITTEGRLVLNDSIKEVQAIGITGVPLDVPRAILAQVHRCARVS